MIAQVRKFCANEGRRRDFLSAVFFLTPNMLGFLCFVAIPVGFSMCMSFTNWNLTNIEPLHFVGFKNYRELICNDPQFWQYFINTLYLMLGLPFSIAGSLILAILLVKPIKFSTVQTQKRFAFVAIVFSFIAAGLFLLAGRVDAAFIVVVLGLISICGVVLNVVFFRTVFYLPYFTSGVAMFILWKNLLSTDNGLINNLIVSTFNFLKVFPRAIPALFFKAVAVAIIVLALRIFVIRISNNLKIFKEAGYTKDVLSSILTFSLLSLCSYLIWKWPELLSTDIERIPWLISVQNLFGVEPEKVGIAGRYFGLGAKDAIVMMGIWATAGGNNMLLYLAGMSNIPKDLYEAAQIDGAGMWSQFKNVTWPQLAPTTFFIVIMSTIAGLQGGFEQAYIMTRGGPAGTTTTLGYYIYRTGFEDFNLGYSSAVAWFMFAIIFALTFINWKYGNRAVND